MTRTYRNKCPTGKSILKKNIFIYKAKKIGAKGGAEKNAIALEKANNLQMHESKNAVKRWTNEERCSTENNFSIWALSSLGKGETFANSDN